MKAFTRYVYGGPEILRLEEVAKPSPAPHHIVVRIKGNSVNPADWRILRGEPFFARFTFGLLKPRYRVTGSDFSGIVVAVGKYVEDFKIGDRVFGSTLLGGAFAEYINIPASSCAVMPDDASFVEMASLPIAGVTALGALLKYGELKAGEKILINGSTGGVGHFAIQIAKAYGAKVTAVCSSTSVAFATALGADTVIAYDKEDIREHKVHYDLIVDTHGNLSYDDYRRMGKRGVAVGFTTMKQMLLLLLEKTLGIFPVNFFTVDLNKSNLEVLKTLVQDRKIKPHIQKTYSYEQIPAAISHIEAIHPKGKIAITWEGTKVSI